MINRQVKADMFSKKAIFLCFLYFSLFSILLSFCNTKEFHRSVATPLGVLGPPHASFEKLAITSVPNNIFDLSQSSSEESVAVAFNRTLSIYALKNHQRDEGGMYYAGDLPSIYNLLRIGYPSNGRGGACSQCDAQNSDSTFSVSSNLISYFIKDPIKSFDSVFGLYPLIKTLIGNDLHFYSMLAFYIEALAEVDFNWKVIKNPTYLNGDYNSYSELIFADPKIEALGAKVHSCWWDPCTLEYRTADNRMKEMKWRMIKFFHRRGEFLSNVTGFYILKILHEEAKKNNSAAPFYRRSYELFAERYNNFANRWNAGEKINNPYEKINHEETYDVNWDFIGLLDNYKGEKLPQIPGEEDKPVLSLQSRNFKLNIDFALVPEPVDNHHFYVGPKQSLCGQYSSRMIGMTFYPDESLEIALIAKNPIIGNLPVYGITRSEYSGVGIGGIKYLIVSKDNKPVFIVRGQQISPQGCGGFNYDSNPIISLDQMLKMLQWKIFQLVELSKFEENINFLNVDVWASYLSWYYPSHYISIPLGQ